MCQVPGQTLGLEHSTRNGTAKWGDRQEDTFNGIIAERLLGERLGTRQHCVLLNKQERSVMMGESSCCGAHGVRRGAAKPGVGSQQEVTWNQD